MHGISKLINSSPIFILGATKSGTSLLASLLDNYPNLFVIPRESHFIQYVSGFWVDYRFRRVSPKNLTASQMVDEMINGVVKENYDNNPLGDRPGFVGYDVDRFKDFVYRYKISNHAEAFELYVSSLYYSLYSKKINNNIRIVEKSVENAEYATVLAAMFPQAKFIHILRNPYATFTSCRKFKTINKYPILNDIAFSLKNSYYYLLKNPLSIKNYLIIKFEDLLLAPEKIMRLVAHFLNIDFTSSLLHPTLLGNNWHGNSTSLEKFKGISNTPSSSYLEDIKALEISMVNKFCKPILEKFNYDLLTPNRSCFFPISGESPVTYMKNRITLKII